MSFLLVPLVVLFILVTIFHFLMNLTRESHALDSQTSSVKKNNLDKVVLFITCFATFIFLVLGFFLLFMNGYRPG